MTTEPGGRAEKWPELPLDAWKDTCATLQLWTQIVGKVRLTQAPLVNHWWHSTLYVTARGLTTSPMPHGERSFQIDFDFLDHELRVLTSTGGVCAVKLAPRPVAEFYRKLMAGMADVGVAVSINTLPQEVENPIRFEQDYTHAAYDAERAQQFWRVLLHAERAFQQFRSGFLGKCSPVHFFWGSFDLAVTRFSGRRAPEHPGGVPGLADWVTREAYSHEVSSCGFWPGGGPVPEPAFFAYAYPEPPGFAEWAVQPEGAYYQAQMREFILPYERVRRSPQPDAEVLAFCQSTYEAAADLGAWDRGALERDRKPAPAL